MNNGPRSPREEPPSCCNRGINAGFVQAGYLVALSLLGFLVLQLLRPKTDFSPLKIDMLFTAVSAATASSMSTVEMEAFSDRQLMVISLLMFCGGEIFVSVVGLSLKKLWSEVEQAEGEDYFEFDSDDSEFGSGLQNPFLETDAQDHLISVIWRYILVVHLVGVALVFFYLTLNHSAAALLRSKGLKTWIVAVFLVISTFSNCGFVPTNENMICFRENSVLLLVLIPQILLGNTLFPFCLRILLRSHSKKNKKEEAEYLLKNTSKIEYLHLLPSRHSQCLEATVFGFILIGFLLFSAFEWNSTELEGLGLYRKAVCILFEIVNARHSGETVVDLSKITPALLAFFIVMMYLPPYTSFLPAGNGEGETERGGRRGKQRNGIAESLVFSQLSYIAIFVIIICVTERRSMETDPLNFSVLNITLEVVSAYGNVGFTTGYGCERRLAEDDKCVNRWYGFAGAWSSKGKTVLLIVMLFGRLKQFNADGGQAWKLL